MPTRSSQHHSHYGPLYYKHINCGGFSLKFPITEFLNLARESRSKWIGLSMTARETPAVHKVNYNIPGTLFYILVLSSTRLSSENITKIKRQTVAAHLSLLLFQNCQFLFYPTRCYKIVQEYCHHLGNVKRERRRGEGAGARTGKRDSDSRQQTTENGEERRNTESANER